VTNPGVEFMPRKWPFMPLNKGFVALAQTIAVSRSSLRNERHHALAITEILDHRVPTSDVRLPFATHIYPFLKPERQSHVVHQPVEQDLLEWRACHQ
jgi:hypothetical protein